MYISDIILVSLLTDTLVGYRILNLKSLLPRKFHLTFAKRPKKFPRNFEGIITLLKFPLLLLRGLRLFF